MTTEQLFQKVSLGELLELEYGTSLPDKDRTGLGFPVFGSNGVVGHHSQFLVEGPGIVVGRKGSVGAVCWSAERFWPIDTSYYVVPKGQTDMRWLYWLLYSTDLKRLDAATGVPGLNRNDVYALKVYSPKPEEQSFIATKLDLIDEAIIRTEAVITKFKKVRAGLINDILAHGLDAGGQLRDPVAHPEQFKDSPLGLIPKEWECDPIEKHTISSAYGPRFPGECYSERGNVALMRTTDMDIEGNLSLEQMPLAELPLDEFRAHFLEVGDFLISRSGTCGIGAVFHGYRYPVLPGAFLIRFRLASSLLPEFLRLYVNSARGARRIRDLAEGGVQKNIRGSALLTHQIPVPSTDEQQAMLLTVDALREDLDKQERELLKLHKLKSGLMADLLTGRVRVLEEVTL